MCPETLRRFGGCACWNGAHAPRAARLVGPCPPQGAVGLSRNRQSWLSQGLAEKAGGS